MYLGKITGCQLFASGHRLG